MSATRYVVVKTRVAASRGIIGMLVDADDHARILYETREFFPVFATHRPAALAASEAAESLGFVILEGDAR